MKLSTLPPSLPTLERPIEPAKSAQTRQSYQKPAASKLEGLPWKAFSSTFLTIFLAEMGDKTQIATLLMSAESQSPGLVFAGAAAALIATSLLGVLLGRALATKFSPKTLDTAAGVCLLCVSAMLCWDVVHF